MSRLQILLSTSIAVSLAGALFWQYSDVQPIAQASATSQRSPKPQAKVAKPVENWIYYRDIGTENFASQLRRAGIADSDIAAIRKQLEQQNLLQGINHWQRTGLLVQGGQLSKLKLIVSPLKTIHIERGETGFSAKVFERTTQTQQQVMHGTIQQQLFSDAAKAGLSNRATLELIRLFSWDIDFSRELKPGDNFSLLYQTDTVDGTAVSDGTILAARFKNGDKQYTALRYTNEQGESRYYNAEGRSVRKAFLRMPVEAARISSHFNPNRRHPILNTIRAHRGVDYAAPTGTAIYAAGSGRVVEKGNKGGYGKTVIIQHPQGITTLYAHMSRFADIKVGDKLQQGDVIGYVGATGRVTGPHLHYEFRIDGVHKNPLTVKLPLAEPLPKAQREEFAQLSERYLNQLNSREISNAQPIYQAD